MVLLQWDKERNFMMICPETFYEMRLKGKTPEQIMSVIRGLKQEIGKLKNFMEHPDYKYREYAMCPTESTRLSCTRDYLLQAIMALYKAGGTYASSKSEQKADEFDANIPYISKIVFSMGGFFGGYETRTFTIDNDKVYMEVEHTLNPDASNNNDEFDKKDFFEVLTDMHIGEWRRKYDCRRFGVYVMDGTQWELEIHYSNVRRKVRIHGDNAYPYNFDKLLDLFGIEE